MGQASGVHVGGLQIDQAEVHPAEVLHLGVRRLRGIASSSGYHPVGALLIEMGEVVKPD